MIVELQVTMLFTSTINEISNFTNDGIEWRENYRSKHHYKCLGESHYRYNCKYYYLELEATEVLRDSKKTTLL